IPPITPQNLNIINQIESLVDKIIKIKKEEGCQADTSYFEQQIDHLVYKLYDLTEEEISIIEKGE
ncbi:MAG: hypothetical protein N2516_03160, partial [Dictyoglomaceae bacterium]|nr:hypothetical protein [Dictyoglomaceae bacterium]